VHRPQFGFGRLAMLAAMMIAAASLSGCGRKGSLDLPPTASITNPPPAGTGPSLGEQSDSPAHSFEPAAPASQTPPPPPARKSRFLLDFLLN
jgi:predicted small lipoprotein YifL